MTCIEPLSQLPKIETQQAAASQHTFVFSYHFDLKKPYVYCNVLGFESMLCLSLCDSALSKSALASSSFPWRNCATPRRYNALQLPGSNSKAFRALPMALLKSSIFNSHWDKFRNDVSRKWWTSRNMFEATTSEISGAEKDWKFWINISASL